ncbi:hypothetical protein OCK74_21030 [Chitinophagaceae bacterium LB-8]|uniref:Lipocalin-like domain-containing protein n=1 Tax=Paraflavisolibacter caeni TaxID=2982496 RepID=A0A9X3BIM0_9BACT|nr:hypothetical protein [Paraflavisolibacter caeni]MCU7551617.1 hypothetical protein [Paraflavisolibacter caeni]
MGKYFLLLASALVLLVTSCKKDDSAPTVKELAGTYQFSKMTYQEGSSSEKDVTNDYLNDCAKDDQIILSVSRTYTAVDAGNSCGAGNIVSAWSLLGANTLKLGSELYTIRKYDGKNLELSITGNNRGVTSTLVRYYVRQ